MVEEMSVFLLWHLSRLVVRLGWLAGMSFGQSHPQPWKDRLGAATSSATGFVMALYPPNINLNLKPSELQDISLQIKLRSTVAKGELTT